MKNTLLKKSLASLVNDNHNLGSQNLPKCALNLGNIIVEISSWTNNSYW